MSAQRRDVAVVGGGVIGLSSAFALSQRGFSVTVFDDSATAGASHAAAGMLAPGAESSPEHAALTTLALRARSLWPVFLDQLHASGGTTARMVVAGSLFVSWDSSDRDERERYFSVARRQGITAHEVDRRSSPALFEGVTDRVNAGTYVPDDAFVEPDRVMASLRAALAHRDVPVVSERSESCATRADGVVVTTGHGEWEARCGVVATGVSGPPLDLLAHGTQRLRPVRGVTLRLRGSEGLERPMIRGYVQGRMIYVITHRDGTVIVGASSDEAAETVVETGTVRRLLDDAALLVPEIDACAFVEARVGLRPASSDNLPFFEPLASTPWAWSSGHFRHGFLLAPVAAESAAAFAVERLS